MTTIQRSILPIVDNFKPNFDRFIIYKPKDIVSGDFFWITQEIPKVNGGFIRFAAAVDCTTTDFVDPPVVVVVCAANKYVSVVGPRRGQPGRG